MCLGVYVSVSVWWEGGSRTNPCESSQGVCMGPRCVCVSMCVFFVKGRETCGLEKHIWCYSRLGEWKPTLPVFLIPRREGKQGSAGGQGLWKDGGEPLRNAGGVSPARSRRPKAGGAAWALGAAGPASGGLREDGGCPGAAHTAGLPWFHKSWIARSSRRNICLRKVCLRFNQKSAQMFPLFFNC